MCRYGHTCTCLHGRAHNGILLQWATGSFSYQMTWGLHILTAGVCFAEHMMAFGNSATTCASG